MAAQKKGFSIPFFEFPVDWFPTVMGHEAVGIVADVGKDVLPLGTARRLLSGGTIPIINLAVGIEVTAAFVLLAIEFFKEAEKSERGER